MDSLHPTFDHNIVTGVQIQLGPAVASEIHELLAAIVQPEANEHVVVGRRLRADRRHPLNPATERLGLFSGIALNTQGFVVRRVPAVPAVMVIVIVVLMAVATDQCHDSGECKGRAHLGFWFHVDPPANSLQSR